MQHIPSVSIVPLETPSPTARRVCDLRRNISLLVLTLLTCCLVVSSASAQDVKNTQNNMDSAKRSDFTVDPTTLGLGFQITLANYPGRAGTSLPINLFYSSKQWRIDFYDIEGGAAQRSRIVPKYAEHSKSGWTTSLEPPTLEGLDRMPYGAFGEAICMLASCPRESDQTILHIKRILVHMPDGSTHELRRDDTPSWNPATTGDYLAVDGSRIRYNATNNIIYLPDGSRYELSGGIKFIDRNGNTLSYNSSTKAWTDTLGRVISSPPLDNSEALDRTYEVKGVDGTTLTYTLKWRYLANARTDSGQALRYKADHFTDNTPPSQTEPLFNSHAGGLEHVSSDTTQTFNPIVLHQIELPNGQAYTFTYNVWGEIDKVVYPTGAYERYQYEPIDSISQILKDGSNYTQANRGVTKRWVSETGDGTDESQHYWQYLAELNSNASIYTVKIIAPDTSYTKRLMYGPQGESKFGFEHVLNGKAYDEQVYSSTAQMLRRTLTEWTNSGPLPTAGPPYSVPSATRDARVIKQVEILMDSTDGYARAATTIYRYDQASQPLNVTSVTQYGYDSTMTISVARDATIDSFEPASSLAVRTTETTYLEDAAYTARNLVSLPTAVKIRQGELTGVIVAQSAISYDEAAYPVLTYPSATNWTDPQPKVRGLVTTTSSWLNTTNTWLSSHAQYDQYGSIRNSWDARDKISKVEYADSFSDDLSEGITRNTFAYPTHTESPDPDGDEGPLSALTSDTTYDFMSGAVTSQTDANDQTSTMEYALKDYLDHSNVLQRLTKVNRPDGGWTVYAYGDQVGDLYVETRTALDATRYTQARQEFDKMGRATRSFALESGTTYMVSDVQYDHMGRVWRASNPYRMQGLNGAVNPAGLWTTNSYDELGRVKSVTLPDQTTVQTSYDGIYTTVTDQAGKSRRQKVDALGRIVRVDEPGANGSLGEVETPVQPSLYDYDTLGNLIHIKQGIGEHLQHRYFKYDSLSRLTYERQVEQIAIHSATDSITGNNYWTRKLIYDEVGANDENNTGLLTSQYDARNVHTEYAYDRLGRIAEVKYSDGTPTVTNIYDRPRDGYHNKGRLSEVQTAAVAEQPLVQMPAIPATSQSYDYDLMGRVHSQQQTVGAQPGYTLTYGYNLGGQLTSETYPSGKVVNYNFDGAARLAGVTSGANTYASNFVYSAKGTLISVGLGNGATESFDYNNRFQLTTLSLIKDGNTLQRYEYKYGQVDASAGAVDETKNNGQIARIEGYIGTDKQWQQRFSYDSLGRLSKASESRGDNNQQSYLNNYQYDTFGNRYQSQASNQNALGFTAVEDLDISKSTNRFLFTQIAYDAAGNILEDSKFRGRQYRYDANNRQRWTALTDDTALATSVYDGAGQRVATIANGTTSYMVYDAGGKLVAEYGQVASSTSGTSYVFSDHQGSPRVVMNQSDGVSRHDYQPFGEEIASNIGQRTTTQGYEHADSVRQKYAGMEKDEATGMAHTLWRKYDGMSGRWTSPDPYAGSMTIADPQTFNRYSYVNNDPLNLTDATGLMALGADGDCAAKYSTCSDGGERRESEAESAYEQGLQDRNNTIAQEDKGARKNEDATLTNGNPEDVSADNQNALLFTDGTGIVRGVSSYRNIPGRDTHYQLADGTVHTIHVYGDETATKSSGLYIPASFSKIEWIGKSTVVATNKKTGEVLLVYHVLKTGAKKPNNDAGSRYIGQIGGPSSGVGSTDKNNRHSHIELYRNRASQIYVTNWRMAPTLRIPQGFSLDINSSMSKHMGDFRTVFKR